MHSFSIYLDNLIADFQSRVPGLATQGIVKGGDGDGVVPKLESHRLSHRNQQRLCQRGGKTPRQTNCQYGRDYHSSHVQPSISCKITIPQLENCNR